MDCGGSDDSQCSMAMLSLVECELAEPFFVVLFGGRWKNNSVNKLASSSSFSCSFVTREGETEQTVETVEGLVHGDRIGQGLRKQRA